MNKINTINGVLMASQDELNEHVENGIAHVTAKDRQRWDASGGLIDKLSQDLNNIKSEVAKVVQSLGGANGAIELDDSLQVTLRDGVPTLGINRQASLTWEGTQTFGEFRCVGPANFSSGVTMSQGLTVAGTTYLSGGASVGQDGLSISDRGVPGQLDTIKLSACWMSPDEQILRISSCGHDEFIDLSINKSNNQIYSCARVTMSSGLTYLALPDLRVQSSDFRGPARFRSGVTMDQSLTVAGMSFFNDQVNVLQSPDVSGYAQRMLTVGITGKEVYQLRLDQKGLLTVRSEGDQAECLTMTPDGGMSVPRLAAEQLSVTGATTFGAGVTMDHDLHINGVLYSGESRLAMVDAGSINMTFEDYEGRQYRWLATSTDGGTYLRMERDMWPYNATDPDPTDTLTCGESDKRYTRCMMLTAAEYEALSTKEDVLYVLTDVHKLYFGSIAIN